MTSAKLLGALLFTASLAGAAPARAAPVVRGVVRPPRGLKPPPPVAPPGYVRIPNYVLATRPPTHDIRQWMVVALEGAGLKPSPRPRAAFVIKDAAVEPPLVAGPPGTVVTIDNADAHHHILEPVGGAFMKPARASSGQRVQHTFTKPGVYRIRSSEAPHIVATVVITPQPRVAVPDRQGAFQMAGVPSGTYTLRVWYRGRFIHRQLVSIGSRGFIEVVIPPGGGVRKGGGE